MDINELLRGVDCPCGKFHTCDIKYVYIEPNATERLRDICAEYKNVLTTKGKEKLKEETQQIEVTALSTDYKVKWDLGDIVDIDIDDWKITTQLRITEVEEVIENGTKSIYPTFGQPLAEKIELDN